MSSAITYKSRADLLGSQIRQGIANNTKGTAFVVYEDVMDAKQACDKLNGFNFQSRYLVGKYLKETQTPIHLANWLSVLYHQPEKMIKSKEDLESRKENLEQLKKQHGIE
jgi:pre-mRNA branch site protein p14